MFNPFIPSIKPAMEKLIDTLVNLTDPPINISGLNTIHFVDSYPAELFEFQKSVGHAEFVTENKIATGNAQVIHVLAGQGNPTQTGYHIFISKLIASNIYLPQLIEDNAGRPVDEKMAEELKKLQAEKNTYIRMIRHELAHVEDYNNQDEWGWLVPTFREKNLQTKLRYDAHRLWAEFYACRRSNFIYDPDIAAHEVSSMISNFETAEKEICDLRWKYNTKRIEIDDFIRQLHDYICSAFIYCCYLMGHMDLIYEHLIGQLHPELYPSRIYKFFPQLWDALRRMTETYPNWIGPEIYDEVSDIILQSIEEFDVFPEQTVDGVYYHIPVKKIMTRHEEKKEMEGSL